MAITAFFVNLVSVLILLLALSGVVLLYIIWKRSKVVEIHSEDIAKLFQPQLDKSWNGVERRSGFERRSGKERRSGTDRRQSGRPSSLS
jgi:hypothetical protein